MACWDGEADRSGVSRQVPQVDVGGEGGRGVRSKAMKWSRTCTGKSNGLNGNGKTGSEKRPPPHLFVPLEAPVPVDEEEALEVTELRESKVRGEDCCAAFAATDSATDVGGGDHPHIIGTVADAEGYTAGFSFHQLGHLWTAKGEKGEVRADRSVGPCS